jgi:hypothetical protein
VRRLFVYLADYPANKRNSQPLSGVIAAVRIAFGNRVFNHENNIRAEELLRDMATRLDLSLLSAGEQSAVMEAVLREIWAHARERGPMAPLESPEGINPLRLVVVVDEAHAVSRRGDRAGGASIIDTLVREGRKFGICLVLASQGVGDFSKALQANAAAWLVMRTMDEAEARQIARKCGVSVDMVKGLTNAKEALCWDGRSTTARRFELSTPLQEEAFDEAEYQPPIPAYFPSNTI